MRHLIWILIHYVFFLILPEFGASISLIIFLLFEISTTFYKNRRFSFISFYYIGLFITIGANIKVIYEFYYGDGIMSYSYAIMEFFPISSLILAFGNQAIALGYGLRLNFKLPKIDFSVKLSRQNLYRIFLIGILFSFKTFWIFFVLPGSLQTIIDVIPIICIFILGKFAGRFSFGFLYVLALILTVMTAFNAILFSYLRMEIILPILVFILSYFIGSNSLKSFFSVKFIPVLFLVFLFLSFFSIFGEQRSNLSVGISRLTEFNDNSSNKFVYEMDEEEKLSPFERSSNIAQVSAVVGLTESNGYYKGLASSPLIAAFIPRVFWPEKPAIALGVWFAVEIGAASETEDWYNNSINMTIPGNLFLDFGWIGLLLGCFLIGAFIKLLWTASGFYDSKFNLLGTFLGVYLLFTGFLGIGADLQILITYLAIYLVLFIFNIFFKRTDENTLYRTNLARK